ncbi:hypothetical protein LB553_00925 [Mesorhizobium sp. CA8]|uniref:hypothetical protein n=1 Tax=Mesorhizobium sp. CA8 TaxID=2876637 RepID=UPI001CD03952|nr:hypothetical protein [Mesorhizobium sp. CA8]MBZ9759450.1 hypothetical protein [Mesorhizobium sp. CA8]
MLTFPTNPNHPANQIDIAEVAERVRAGGQRLRAMDARRDAMRKFAENKKVRALYYVCNEADDTVSLRKFGPRGAAKVLWNYGGTR